MSTLAITLSCDLGKQENGGKSFQENDGTTTPDSEQTEVQTGKLSLTLNEVASKSKALVSEVDLVRGSFKITGTCESGSTFNLTTNLTTVEIVALVHGEWQIAVEALNAEGIFIAQGSGDVEINENQTSTLEITVMPYEGFGTFELALEWQAEIVGNQDLQGELINQNGISYEIPIEISGNSATLKVTVPAGYYTLQIYLYESTDGNETTMGVINDIVQIVANGKTYGQFTLMPNSNFSYGTLDLAIQVDMKLPIEVELLGIPEQILEEETVTITANTPYETGPVEYIWLLNGRKVSQEKSYTLPDNLQEGTHHINVLVFNTLGDRGGSAGSDLIVINNQLSAP